jgi:hypothetical protein
MKVYCKNCKHYRELVTRTIGSCEKEKREVIYDTWYERRIGYFYNKYPEKKNADNDCPDYKEAIQKKRKYSLWTKIKKYLKPRPITRADQVFRG